MAEINLKSPHFKQVEMDTLVIHAEITSGACVTCTVHSHPDITVAISGTTACDTLDFTFSGIEAAAGVALDSTRPASFEILDPGTAAGATTLEVASLVQVASTFGGSAGTRTILFETDTTLSAGAVVASTDSLSNALVRITLPIKSKDF